MFIASFDGVVLSNIVSDAGKFSKHSSSTDILLFGSKSLISWSIVYLAQFLLTLCMASIVKDFNIKLKQNFFWNKFNRSDISLDSSEIISNLSNDFKLIENQYFQECFSLIANISLFLISLIYMIRYDPVVSIIFLTFSFLPMVVPLIFSKTLTTEGNKWSKSNELYVNDIKEYIQGYKVLKTYSIYGEIYQKSKKSLMNLEQQNYKLIQTQAFAEFVSSVLSGISFVVPFVIGCLAIKYSSSSFSFSSLVAIFLLNDRVVGPLNSVAEGINKIKTTEDLRKKLFFFKANYNSEIESSDEKNDNSSKLMELKIEGLKYKLSNGILLNINADFKKKFKVLIYGDSGCGKTTLLNIMRGNLPVQIGEIIAIDSNNNNINLSTNTAYIAQSPYIFDASIFENITLFQNDKFSRKDVENVLKQVSLYSELGSEASLDYQCGVMGEKLSGGQMQKVEIARALLRNKKLILIDEATANLDKNNADKIRDILFNLSIPFIEVAHHYNLNDERYTNKLQLKNGKLNIT